MAAPIIDLVMITHGGQHSTESIASDVTWKAWKKGMRSIPPEAKSIQINMDKNFVECALVIY